MITALILLIPLLGNHFVDGWNWPPRAFALVGTLIFGIGVTYELITRNREAIVYRAAVALALAAAFALVWGNFIQSADDVNPAATMYFWVPLVGVVGATIARFRPEGMSRALFLTAIAQALVLASMLVRNLPVASWSAAVWRGFGGNTFLFMLFVGSALLFGKARREEPVPVTV